MKTKTILFAAMLMLTYNNLFSHAMWIEAKPTGKIGEAQEVEIYFGEYASNDRNSVAKWFSNIKEFSLWLTEPSGEKKQLVCATSSNCFKTNFIPVLKGVYTLSIDHVVKDMHGKSKIHYYSAAAVLINESLNGINNINNATELAIKTIVKNHKINAPIDINVLNKTVPMKDADFTVQSPEGWTKDFKTDNTGRVTFEPVWAGRYMLQSTYTEDKTGTQNGKEYNSIWYCITYCIDVEK